MLCLVCTEASDIDTSVKIRNTFIYGNNALLLENIKLHELSNNHIKAN